MTICPQGDPAIDFTGLLAAYGENFTERVLAHYRANRVDPRSKVLVFSDGLDIPKVMRLYQHFHGRCQLAFGVGTNLTNDVGPEPLQIVIKMVRCNGQPVAKIAEKPLHVLLAEKFGGDPKKLKISRDPAKNTVNLDNKEVPGEMAAMKMDYELRGAKVADLPADGTAVEVTVHDSNGSYYVTGVKPKK